MIKLITDTSCDIPADTLKDHDIAVVPLHILVDEQDLKEGIDITSQEFYHILEGQKGRPPKTAQPLLTDFLDEYVQAYKKGYDEIICVTMAKSASGTYQSAHLAYNMFLEKYPEAQDKLGFHLVDSRNYSISYGISLLKAADMRDDGASCEEILNFLEKWMCSVETYFFPYSLDTVQYNSRINKIFILFGKLLKVLPIISLTDAHAKILDRTRGVKRGMKMIMDMVEENIVPDGEFGILHGTNQEDAKEFSRLLSDTLGYEPFGMYLGGPVIATNAGSEYLGICFTGEERKSPSDIFGKVKEVFQSIGDSMPKQS